MLWASRASAAAQKGYQPLETELDELGDVPQRLPKSRPIDLRRRCLSAHLPVSRSRLVLGLTLCVLLALTLAGIRSWRGEHLPSREELDAGYFKTGKIWDHNLAIAKQLDRCAALGLLRNTSLPDSAINLQPESAYDAAGCGLNATTIIIVSSLYFAEAYAGATFGEAVWAQSAMTALNRWGYSYMFSSQGWWNHDMRKTMELYHQYPGQVRLVLADPEQVVVCFGEQRDTCLRTKSNPDGVEGWRVIGFNFWDTNDTDFGPAWYIPEHPLGERFTLSPAPSAATTHFSLPYSIEPLCRGNGEPSYRHKTTRAYLMAKKSSYLSPTNPSFPWSLPDLAQIAKAMDIQFAVGLADNDDPVAAELVQENGIQNLGQLDKNGFKNRLSESFVLVGAGRPFISPSPWDGLCLGVPFINPILSWDNDDPNNRTSWKLQHGHMIDLEPPYVYTVRAHDHDGLQKAMLAASETPIKSYIPEEMTFDAVSHRVGELVEWDWQTEGEKIKNILDQY